MTQELNWDPFLVSVERGEAPRSIDSFEGVGDRLRAAAFAEIQAREAFLWAAKQFEDAEDKLKDAWRNLAREEDKHLSWLLKRMTELGVDVKGRKVSLHLWYSLVACKTAKEFAQFMASAEERGKRAGERFHRDLLKRDPETARIFGTIAQEETAHIELANRYFPELPNPLVPRAVSSSSVTS